MGFKWMSNEIGSMADVAWAALFLSLLSLILFIISNYKSIFNNTIQFLINPELNIQLETGSITSEDGTVTVGGSPDDFEQELINSQEKQENGVIKIPISQIQHPDDHSETTHFDICVVNNGNSAYQGEFTVIADMPITNRNPDMPDVLHEMSESYLKLEREEMPPGAMFNSETLMPQQKYTFSDKIIPDDGKSSSSWYINEDILSGESGNNFEYEIRTKFEPILSSSNLPWWIPKFVGSIELRPVETTFLIKNDVNHG